MKTTKTTSTNYIPAGRAGESSLDRVLSDAEQTLAKRDKVFAVLEQSHHLIPELLRQRVEATDSLGAIEITGGDTSADRDRLADIESRRLAAIRQRGAAISQLVEQEPDLSAARDAVDRAREQHASAIVATFQQRYREAVEQLQRLWSEGDQLAVALRTSVAMPIPARITGIPAPAPEFLMSPLPDVREIKLTRIMGDSIVPTPIDATAERLGRTLDGLDGAITFAASLRGLGQRIKTLTVPDSRDFNPQGVYIVTREFVCPVSQLRFEPGSMIDASLLDLVFLRRSFVSKTIRLVSQSRPAGAAA